MSNYIHAIYDDDDLLLEGVKKLKEEGVNIEEVYTPFPVHGLDSAMGLKKTRISIASFIYGMIGVGFGIFMTYYMMISDWPQDIGGKPSVTFLGNLPSFIPVIFEIGVFFAAHFMVITFFFKCKLFPFSESISPDVRTTDDKFLVEIDISKNEGKNIKEIVKKTKVFEVNKK